MEYPEDVTEEEKDVIRNVIDYDSLNELYNPTLHDPVKYTYNQHSTKEEITEYFKVWLKMLIRHPDSYIQATLNSTLGGFYMEKNSSWVYYKFDNRVKMDSNLYVSNNEETAIFFQKLISLLQKIPGINVFFTLALYVWISVFFFFEQIRQRKYKYMLCGVISLLSVLLLFICPANGNFRYIMPIFYICFFEVGICCADKIKGGK